MWLGTCPPLEKKSMSRHEYSPEVQNALSQLGWHGRLGEAETADEVVAIARDYLALWSPEELASISPDLRPAKLVDTDDVSSYALALVQAQMGRGTPGEAVVHKLGNFFGSASLRITQLLRRSEFATD